MNRLARGRHALPHAQGRHTERADHFKGEETENVHNLVVGPYIEMGLKVDKLAKSLRFAIGKACLSTIAVMDVFVARHAFGDFIRILGSAVSRLRLTLSLCMES